MVMNWLTDDVVGHLRQVAAWPDVSGTKYAVIEEIGRGGMGTVYRAVDTRLGREVALKVINAAGDDAALAARLAVEARVLARLDHPGVVPVHDSGVLADGRAFYVMKLVRGEVLDDYLARPDAAIGLDQRLRIFERIAEPIAFAHAHGIVHRDLKPRNVMIGPFGEVLVMDWGAARVPADAADGPGVTTGESETSEREAAGGARADGREAARDVRSRRRTDEDLAPDGDASAGQASGRIVSVGVVSAGATARGTAAAISGEAEAMNTRPGVIIGTPGYMSPEQARGADDVDSRADVYALGALLLQMLDGQPPPVDPAAAAAPLARVPGLSKRLRAICAKAMAPQPDDRYDDAGALAEDVARFRAGEPVRACPETWIDRLARFYATYRTAILLVLAYLTMRVLVAFFWRR
jgi:serine/threonine-protein kinase